MEANSTTPAADSGRKHEIYELPSPARRYETAARAARLGRALLPEDGDGRTWRLANYLARERACRTASERQELAARCPVIAMVLALHREPHRVKASWLEALLLARESTQRVARDCGLSLPVVKAYRACFLSLGDRLDDQQYVLERVIRPEFTRGDAASASRRGARKFIGYFCGRAALDVLIGAGATQPLQLWQSLPELIRKLVLSRDVVAVAELFTSRVGVPEDPAELTSWLALLSERIEAAAPSHSPRNVFGEFAASAGASAPSSVAS
jgi:hypothetical protein